MYPVSIFFSYAHTDEDLLPFAKKPDIFKMSSFWFSGATGSPRRK
jgi:hypothetical protein